MREFLEEYIKSKEKLETDTELWKGHLKSVEKLSESNKLKKAAVSNLIAFLRVHRICRTLLIKRRTPQLAKQRQAWEQEQEDLKAPTLPGTKRPITAMDTDPASSASKR